MLLCWKNYYIFLKLQHSICTATGVAILFGGASVLAIQGDSGWYPTFYRHQLNTIRMWNRVVTMSDDRLFMLDLNKSNS